MQRDGYDQVVVRLQRKPLVKQLGQNRGQGLVGTILVPANDRAEDVGTRIGGGAIEKKSASLAEFRRVFGTANAHGEKTRARGDRDTASLADWTVEPRKRL